MPVIWVPVDVSGPVGAFSSFPAARSAVQPYLDKIWAGCILQWEVETDLEDGMEVAYVMHSQTTFPLFVAPLEEAQAKHASLLPTGLVESKDDFKIRRSNLGELIPAAEKRLAPMLFTEEDLAKGEAAHRLFMSLLDENARQVLPPEERLPLAAFAGTQANPIDCRSAKSIASSSESPRPWTSPNGASSSGSAEAASTVGSE